MARSADLVAGVDVATAAVRALAVDAAGRPRAEASSPLPEPRAARPGWWEQDATAWWPTVVTVLGDLTRQLDSDRHALVAVCVCATSGTVVALDAAARPVGAALTYADQRATGEATAAQDAGAERWSRLGLRIQASFGLPKWAWLLRQPEIRAETARLAHASDVVVNHLIGGSAPTDWSHALKSGYDPQRGEWATEATDALGIAPRLLPEVRRPTEAVGCVSREAARDTGLPTGCEVRLGMTDSCASQLAAGAATPGRFVSVLGSTLVLKGASRDLVSDPTGAVYSHRHPDGWWLPGGASSTGGRALTAGFGGHRLTELDQRAARRGPADCVVYPLVGRGERFPFAAPDAEGFMLGTPRDEVERYRATLEGVAFVERLGYERLAALGAIPDGPIASSGRGSSSAVWNYIRASVLGGPVVAKPSAGTDLGACILAAAGTVHPDLDTAMRAMAVTGEEVRPQEDEQAALQRNHDRFVSAIRDRSWLD